MACNRDSSADGASPSPPPVPSVPGSCSNPDAVLAIPCCNSKCHNCGCAASMNLCSKCSSERLCKEENAFNASEQNLDLGIADEPDAAAGVHAMTTPKCFPAITEEDKKEFTASDIANLHAVMKFKSSTSSRFKIGVSAREQQQQQSGWCKILEQRIPSPLSLTPSAGEGSAMPVTSQEQERAVSRCGACRKRTGLRGFKCRCGHVFCASHRYSDKHDCSFDYKAAGRLIIAKENPVVVASKIIKI